MNTDYIEISLRFLGSVICNPEGVLLNDTVFRASVFNGELFPKNGDNCFCLFKVMFYFLPW